MGGGGGTWWWTEFKPSLQTTFILVHVGDDPLWRGKPTRDDLGSCSGTLALSRPALSCPAVIYLCVSVSLIIISTAYTRITLSCHVVC